VAVSGGIGRGAAPGGRDSAAGAPPAGNVYDKYRSRNPLARWLVGRFLRSLRDLLEQPERPARALEVGCGEGELVRVLREREPGARAVALDLDRGVVRQAAAREPSCLPVVGDGQRLPLAGGAFDLVLCCETLEHLPDPAAALAEIRRVLRPGGALVASVPREPVWRILNVLRGAYLGRLGNTPGHVNHYGRRSFLRLLERHGFEVEAVRAPLPWSMARARAPER
jgi:ubiquinone/menaquinone biosynthesis C-methylase UbiE